MNTPAPLAITRARPFDSRRGVLGPESTLLLRGGLIEALAPGLPVPEGLPTLDAAGRVALPGLIDAHVHVTAGSHDLAAYGHEAPSYVAAQAGSIMRDMLLRGFTTVRDAAGADLGLQRAQQQGLFEGPRLFIAGFPISQTGGHADLRPRSVRQRDFYCSCAGLGLLGAVADGVGEVRRAVREQVRTGANQIKLMAGGGISSPADPLEGTQFSLDELRAACEEADAANLYAMAHAYSPRAVTRAVQCGVRSIEHGNLIDEATARVMKTEGAYLVPTLATYEALSDEGQRLGWPPHMLDKLALVGRRGIEAVRIARAEGVPVVFGTDLLGHMHARQPIEFALRAQAMPAAEVLQSATHTAARLLREEGRLGELVPGAHADLLLCDGDPTQDLAPLADPATHLRLIVQAGRVVKNTLQAR